MSVVPESKIRFYSIANNALHIYTVTQPHKQPNERVDAGHFMQSMRLRFQCVREIEDCVYNHLRVAYFLPMKRNTKSASTCHNLYSIQICCTCFIRSFIKHSFYCEIVWNLGVSNYISKLFQRENFPCTNYFLNKTTKVEKQIGHNISRKK